MTRGTTTDIGLGAARARSIPSLVAMLLLAGCARAAGSSDSPGTTCDVTGVWQGTMSYRSASGPIGFTLADDGGVISGVERLYAPGSTTVAAIIPLSGTVDGGNAQWNTLGRGFAVAGSFAGDHFAGSITMPAPHGGSIKASLALSRTDGGTP